MLVTYVIFKDGNEVKRFESQIDDFCILKYLLDVQGNSMDYAFRHGGYKVHYIKEDGKVFDYRTDREVK